jgi:hypothetical protein
MDNRKRVGILAAAILELMVRGVPRDAPEREALRRAIRRGEAPPVREKRRK